MSLRFIETQCSSIHKIAIAKALSRSHCYVLSSKRWTRRAAAML